MLAQPLSRTAEPATDEPTTCRTPSGIAPSPAEPTAAAHRTSFSMLDELVRDRARAGIVTVVGRGADLAAVGAHVARRSRAVGRPVVRVQASSDEPWRELASSLGVEPNGPPESVAAAIRSELGHAVAVVHGHQPSHWGAAIQCELRGTGCGEALLVVLSESRSEDEAEGGEVLVLTDAMTAEEVGLWWSAATAERPYLTATPAALEALFEGSFGSVARPSQCDRRLHGLSDDARALLHAIQLCRRACSAELLTLLGSEEACDELLEAGLVLADARGRVTARGELPTADDGADRLCVATALCANDAADPWAWMRAAELFAEAGEAVRAERAAVQALSRVADRAAREDFYRRIRTLSAVAGPLSYATLLRLAERALEAGDLEQARSFATEAARGGEQPEVLLIVGRVSTARGDFGAAGVALRRAEELASSRVLRARVAVQQAELRYAAGEHDVARRYADLALEQASDAEVGLAARNVLGKLLLAAGRWQEAEAHFTSDAALASCAGSLEGELRARLNRAIAVLQDGRLNEARTLLEALHGDARRFGQPHAEAMALANLANVATLAHEYADALELYEQAIESTQAVGDQLRRASLTMNLAELRLRLGLGTEAEQALRFARRACGPSVPASHVASLCYLSAQIRLGRGQTTLAMADVEEALAASANSHNGAKVGQCHRLAARIALEDGNLERARQAIDGARTSAADPAAEADIALLEAMLKRAQGEAFAEEATEALTLAHRAEDLERQQRAHVLLHQAAWDEGHRAVAGEHLRRAVELRERLVAGLDGALRDGYLSRSDQRELSQLEERQHREVARATADLAEEAAMEATGTARQRDSRGAPRTMVGQSRVMQELGAMLRKVGASNVTVLVQGESGTGKELVAEALHHASARRSGPLVKVNCAALVETLLLSELFGHEKGAFTGASNRRRGRFEQAAGGTLFLDEIGDISPRTQTALLRVLQERTFERVGGTTALRADVRIICATNRDLKEMVRRGQFREDLYYRLCGVSVQVPPLRDRLDDLPLLCDAILQRMAREQGCPVKRVSPAASDALATHHWPGNVRELENAVCTAALFAEHDTIEASDFARHVAGLSHICAAPMAESVTRLRQPSEAAGIRVQANPSDVVYAEVRKGASLPDLKRELERACIARALEDAEGNITRAAGLLGMKRPRLSQLVNQLGLKAEGGRS